jgi:four helix bundle protein
MEHKTHNKRGKDFHGILEEKIDEFAHNVYSVSKLFPREELYGITSQMRRAALSVALNYIEGYARLRSKVYKNFLETAYGSLKEVLYLLKFSLKEKFIKEKDFNILSSQGDEIGAMLWSTMNKL